MTLRVIVCGDDFGYVESVAETIRRGRLIANDWLEPSDLRLPVVGAGVYAVTGGSASEPLTEIELRKYRTGNTNH